MAAISALVGSAAILRDMRPLPASQWLPRADAVVLLTVPTVSRACWVANRVEASRRGQRARRAGSGAGARGTIGPGFRFKITRVPGPCALAKLLRLV